MSCGPKTSFRKHVQWLNSFERDLGKESCLSIYKSEYKTSNVNQVMFGLNISRFLDFKERREKMYFQLQMFLK